MLNQFSRTQLLLGQDGMERLFRARVAVFGIGGVGGYTVEALARSAWGRWTYTRRRSCTAGLWPRRCGAQAGPCSGRSPIPRTTSLPTTGLRWPGP